MKKEIYMKTSKARLILGIILCYVTLSFYEPFWRLTIRGLMEGQDFAWEYAGIGGIGVSGDYWIIALISALGIGLLFVGWRRAGTLFRWVVFVWSSLLLLSSLAIVLSDPSVKVEADTLHLSFPYAFVILPLDLIFFALIVYWVFKYRNVNVHNDIPRWNRMNNLLILVAIGLFPIEYLFFNLGEQHDMYDQIGVLLTFLQWIMIHLAFHPWNIRTYARVNDSIHHDDD